MDLNMILEKQKTLNETEMVFKELCQKYNKKHFDLPSSLDQVSDILKEANYKADSGIIKKLQRRELDEETFFQNSLDVGIYRHLRYLPAIWHSHTFLEVVCVFSGTCTNYVLEQELNMGTGDICIIAPDTPHAVSTFSDDAIIFNIELRTSTFETAFFGTLVENDILSDFFTHMLYHSKTHPYLHFITGGYDKELFDYILYAYMEFTGNHQYKNRMLNNVIMAFFTILLRHHGEKISLQYHDTQVSDENVVFLLKYIQENYRTVTLSELSDFFNYSERQIQRIIKSYTGVNFRETIQKLKMRQAARMLENPDITIAYIAEDLGYSNPGNFRYVFKRCFGVTPVEYRDNRKFS